VLIVKEWRPRQELGSRSGSTHPKGSVAEPSNAVELSDVSKTLVSGHIETQRRLLHSGLEELDGVAAEAQRERA
jgi:hypothetical protein